MKYTNTDNVIISCSNSIASTTTNNSVNEFHSVSSTNNTTQNASINHATLEAGIAISQSTQSDANNTNANNMAVTTTTTPPDSAHSGESNFSNSTTPTTTTATTDLFCEQVTTVTNLFEKWNDCERTVVMYALLKRLRYPTLKFLQYSIESNLSQNMITSQSNLSTVVVDINANNPSYLQNLLNAYKTFQPGDVLDGMSSCSSDKDSMPCYGSDFQITTSVQCDERKLYARKEDILHEVLNMLPLLKPGNDEAKVSYLALIPVAVKDTMQQIVPTELVQQIFSYLLIHPAITSDDRKSLNVWLRHLEDHIQAAASGITNQSYFLQPSPHLSAEHLGTTLMTTSASSSSSSSSAASCSSNSNLSITSSSIGNLTSSHSTRHNDWQTIAPPSKHHQHLNYKSPMMHDWAKAHSGTSGGCGSSSSSSHSHNSSVNPLCDNLNGITLNELASSQNSLGLSLGSNLAESSALVNGVVAAANVTVGALFGNGSNSMINNINCDDPDNSFSKNGTEILDFEPISLDLNKCDTSSSLGSNLHQQYAAILSGNVGDQFGDSNRYSLDSKLAALKTRRSNSLTTQTISSSSSSSNSSVITVNDNCSNSTENLAQFANKPRSFSLSIEHQRGGLMNSGSDTRLDEFKPSYIKFQTRNIGMSGIGLWLKSLRLHKYMDLFKNMTYEEMLKITEEYLQSVGVTKGASHKLALCIDKLKERVNLLIKLEQELHTGQVKVSTVVEELTNIVLTPMKPLEAVNQNSGEDNVCLHFLRVLDLVSATLQKDPYGSQDDDTLGVFLWILDRSLHNEALAHHYNQLKEHKFKLSKLKMSITPKLHHLKSGGSGSISKPRWNGKNRKLEPKTGSSDRINHRKNSNDMLNFSFNCLQQHPAAMAAAHHQQSYVGGEYSGGYNTHQYKSSSYPSFVGNQTPHQQQQLKLHPNHQQQQHNLHQQHQVQQILQQQQHFPALPQQTPQQHHRRSLNNLILVSGGPQQPQKMIFKPGQGMLPTNSSNENLTIDAASAARSQQQHKANLNKLESVGAQQCQPQPKKSMAAVVMVSNNDETHKAASYIPATTPPQILISGGGVKNTSCCNSNGASNNNNSSMLNNNLIGQQQLQLLAAAAAAVGNNLSKTNSCMCSSGIVGNSNNNNNNNNNNNDNKPCISANCSNCNCCLSASAINHSSIIEKTPPGPSPPQLIANVNHSLKSNYQQPTSAMTNSLNALNDYKSLEQLETLCLQMTEQAIN